MLITLIISIYLKLSMGCCAGFNSYGEKFSIKIDDRGIKEQIHSQEMVSKSNYSVNIEKYSTKDKQFHRIPISKLKLTDVIPEDPIEVVGTPNDSEYNSKIAIITGLINQKTNDLVIFHLI